MNLLNLVVWLREVSGQNLASPFFPLEDKEILWGDTVILFQRVGTPQLFGAHHPFCFFHSSSRERLGVVARSRVWATCLGLNLPCDRGVLQQVDRVVFFPENGSRHFFVYERNCFTIVFRCVRFEKSILWDESHSVGYSDMTGFITGPSGGSGNFGPLRMNVNTNTYFIGTPCSSRNGPSSLRQPPTFLDDGSCRKSGSHSWEFFLFFRLVNRNRFFDSSFWLIARQEKWFSSKYIPPKKQQLNTRFFKVR